MILFCYGTRPESLKLAKIVALCRAKFPVTVWCTNQSPDLLDDRVLKPDNVGPVSAIPFDVFDLVVVQGDTRSTFEAAVAAFNAGVPIMHVEAGVRSGELSSPFPEEAYRKMISVVATYHACTTQHNLSNIQREGLQSAAVRVTGSPIVESVRERVQGKQRTQDTPYAVMTLHRRENRGHFRDIVESIYDTLTPLSFGLANIAWYTHPNNYAVSEAASVNILRSLPLDAAQFAPILRDATVCITDSGGVQEECNVLGVPCVVARTVTDRPESLGKGGATLGGNTREGIAQAIEEALNIDRSTILTSIYGDDTASQTIAEWIGEIVCK